MPRANPKFRIPNSKSLRRGGTYILVVGSALIVSTLGMMALLQQRIQRKGFEASADMEQARLNIESAMRLGLLDIQSDPDWRSTYTASGGEILSASSTEFGGVVLKAIDSYDSDLTDDERDPVVLRAAANSGSATQLAELMLHPTTVPPEVLWKGVVAADDVASNGGSVRSQRPLSCDAITLTSANMYADVEAVSISGSTYHGLQLLIQDKDRPKLPDIAAVVNEYTSRGTAIDILSLPTSTPNLIRNPGIEQGQGNGQPADRWFGTTNPPETATCDVEQNNNQQRNGSFSLYVKNRSGASAGPIHYCTEWIKPNTTYYVEAYIYVPALVSLTEFRLSVYTDGTSSGEQWQGIGSILLSLLDLGKWKKVSGTVQTASWSGELQTAYVKMDTDAGTEEFYVDDFTMREVNRRFLYRTVLSPNSNPFGATNPDGIYVVDCGDAALAIERSRIRGTLVLLNPGAGTAVEGPISWEPAKPGYPALVVGTTSTSYTANMKIAHTRRGLSEAYNSTNFNPTGTPHDAVGEDSDQNDILPSEIRGWVYVGDTLTFGNAPTIHGVVMAGDDIVAGGEPQIHWDPAPIFHPPPGLEGKLELKPREGASTKAVQ